MKKIMHSVNRAVGRLDAMNLWFLGIPFLILLFVPYMILGTGSVFEIHDQLDETLFTYILSARYLGSGIKVYPELLNGVNAGGMLPAAPAFVLLYVWLPRFTAFVIQYFIVSACGFYGMYLCVRRSTGSSFLACLAGGLFCMLPVQPVYGLSVLGVPLLACCFWNLYEEKYKVLSLLGIIWFGLTTHLVLIGYVVLSLLVLSAFWMLWRKQKKTWYFGGMLLLLLVYIAINYELFAELFLGGNGFVSHREEFVNYGQEWWPAVKTVFLESAQHAPSLHKYLILPIVGAVLWGSIRYQKLSKEQKRTYGLLAGTLLLLVLIAVFYGICNCQAVADWQNHRQGFLRYFQAERYYWAYPSLWYLAMAWAFDFIRKECKKVPPLWIWLMLAVLALPTVKLVIGSGNFYRNVNQIRNSEITGYMTWEDYYAEDVMEQIDTYIGRDKTTYRVASLGMSPAVPLFYGFYCIDGYSNNYALSYKHEFRKIIEKELAKREDTRIYFDEWGSRCYVFSSQSGAYWYLKKDADFIYDDLELNTAKMKEMGCDYLFAAARIEHPEKLHLTLEGSFDTKESYYRVYLYRIDA